MSAFATFWAAHYPDAPPLSYMMRAAGVRYWSRFHSLPHSKRYADTAEEEAIILDRQNQLAAAILGENKPCWLVQPYWTLPGDSTRLFDEEEAFQEVEAYSLAPAFSFVDDPEDEDATQWNVMAGLVRWRSGAFDDTLLRIANERVGWTLWMSAESGAVFAPYDGGVDVFLPSKAMNDELRSRFRGWKSAHPTSL